MRILLINKYHFSKGGAERAYFDMARILKERGHEVAFFSMKNPKNLPTQWEKYFSQGADYDDLKLSFWQKIILAQKFIFNFEAYQNLEKLILEFRPDVAHLHNIYHQLSPSVIYALKKHKIPTVMTLHDYRLISPNYNLFLNGKIWEKKSFWACIADKCVKNSYIKSFWSALEKFIHDFLGSYGKIDLFISPSRFLIKKFQVFGFGGKTEYLPNSLSESFMVQAKTSGSHNPSGPLVFFGRLSKEKGVDAVVRAMKDLKKEKLIIAGEGPEKENLSKMVKRMNLESQVIFAGFKTGEDLLNLLNSAKAVIIPSLWYENMPYAVTESLALGKIVIASRIGGIPDLITEKENGFLFEAGNDTELAETIKNLDKYNLEKISEEARKTGEKLKESIFYDKLMRIYSSLTYLEKNVRLSGQNSEIISRK